MARQTPSADRLRGLLIGLAAGDRNGGPIRMAVELAESLADLGRFDVDDVARRYLAWWQDEGFDTGPVAARVFELVSSGLRFDEASDRAHLEFDGMTAGCNPAHRSAPLALLASLDDGDLSEAAMREASLTHRHPLAGQTAATVVGLCRSLVRGLEWPAAERLAGLDDRKGSPTRGGFAPDVLAAAVHFSRHGRDFDSTLQQSIDFAGPANYCPVLVGSLAGARWGASAIGNEGLRHCRALLPRIQAVARQLSLGWV